MLERIKEILFNEASFEKGEQIDQVDFENIKDVLVNDEGMNLTEIKLKNILNKLGFELVDRKINKIEYKELTKEDLNLLLGC